MTLGIIATLAIVLGVVAAVGFFVLKRALRWAVRLFLLGVAVVLLLAGAVMWWWYAPAGGDSPARPNRNGGAATRPANRR
jgi:4-amino-4-deoxy-L-arabinose transferase-like glycosyltransferase